MKVKKVFIFIALLLVILFAVVFSSISTLTPTSTLSGKNSFLPPATSQSIPSATELPYHPLKYSLDISPLPKLDQTVEMTVSFIIEELWSSSLWVFGREQPEMTTESLKKSKLWVDFYWSDIHGSYLAARGAVLMPITDIVQSGNTTWEGNAIENRSITLRSTIKLPKEGVWKIYGYFSGENWTKPDSFMKFIAVADGIAVIMNTQDQKSGPLSYIHSGIYSYDRIGKAYIQTPDESLYPIAVTADISRPPLAGETAKVTCRLNSFNDIPDCTAYINVETYTINSYPISDILVSGNLTWQGYLKKQTPVEFSATIKFPKEGEWRVFTYANSITNENAHYGGESDYIPLTVTRDKSWYGWGHDGPFPSQLASTHTTAPTPAQTLPKKNNTVRNWIIAAGVAVIVCVVLIRINVSRKKKRDSW